MYIVWFIGDFWISVRRKFGQVGWRGDICDRCLFCFCKVVDNSEKSGSGDKLIFGIGIRLLVRFSKYERNVRFFFN